MPTCPDNTDLDRAIVAALASGREELRRLDELGKEAIRGYTLTPQIAAGVGQVPQEISRATRGFAEKIHTHLAEQRDVLSTFNVAFFGRTGAGKSTLLSAFGELDGSGVSPGESDWTTEVQSIAWRGCRLYDTPGINGWGGRKSRTELEAAARRAVEIADVVLLCFDSQSQQDSEFSKVADWVRHFGKPTIAVLNIRNLRWRHPAKVANQTARQNISVPVRQHADNIRTELAGIGLPDTPVVAIHSRRALFARASTPYHGPAERDFDHEREQYGVDYLARWSNFGTLEALLSAGIAAGGAQLRLTSLREGMRAILHDEARSLEALVMRLDERFAEVDRAVSRHLEVLGYLELDERSTYLQDKQWSGDLLSIAETARRAPYRSPADGTSSRYLRSLLKPQLSVLRNNAIRRFNDLEHKAFNERKDIDQDTFAAEVFDEAEIDTAVENVWTASASFLERELFMAAAELQHIQIASERELADLTGTAGSLASHFETAYRAGGLLSGIVAIGGTVALANAWNPIGWATGIVVAGVGIAGSVLGMIGGYHGETAEKQRAEARSKASYAGKTAIHNTFDAIENEFARQARAVAWRAAAPNVKALLREAIVLAQLRQQATTIVTQLDAKAESISISPTVNLLDAAERALLSHSGSNHGDRRDAERVLLGEDWFEAATAPDNTRPTDLDAFASTCRARHDADVVRLRGALAGAIGTSDNSRIAGWTQQLTDLADNDESFQSALLAASAQTRPAIAVAGDFSAGKSSFIKRLLVEFGGNVPGSLHIRADPTTKDIHRYELGDVGLIDTPGFQSGRSGHDDKAVSATTQAALVFVLLHVNLLIGDTARLEGIVNGTDSAPGKWPRMLFLINRCDELGVDPLHSIDEFFSRRDRKASELCAALRSRGIDVDMDHIHGVAADPFGTVGHHLPTTAADYDDNRAWDGIDTLVEALRSLSPSAVAHANDLAALDNAVAQLLHLRAATRIESEEHRAGADRQALVIRALNECLDDAKYLSDTLEHTLTEKVSRHTAKAAAHIRHVHRGDEDGLSNAIESWKSEELRADVEQFMSAAADDIDAWTATHESAISRELAAMKFDGQLGMPMADGEAPQDTIASVARTGGAVTSGAQKLVAAAGTRDVAYRVGKTFGHKFKPWGAVKAGQTVARAGVVLQAVAVAWDVVSWIRTEQKRSSWDETLDSAVKQVAEAGAKQGKEWLYGGDGPVAYLAARRDELAALRDDHIAEQKQAEDRVVRAEQRLDSITLLLNAFEDLWKDDP